MYKIDRPECVEVFKDDLNSHSRGSHKVKVTVLIIRVSDRVTFCSNILFSVCHIQSNITTRRNYKRVTHLLTMKLNSVPEVLHYIEMALN